MSLNKHVSDIASDDRLLNNDILCFTETQLSPTSNISDIVDCLEEFLVDFNNNEDKYMSIAVAYRPSISLQNHNKYRGFSCVSFKKEPSFEFNIILLYRKNTDAYMLLYEMLQYLLNSSNVHILIGDFNIDGLARNIQLDNILSDYIQLVKEPTHLGGSLLDHVYIRKDLLDFYDFTLSVESVFYSDHDAIRLRLFEKKEIDFDIL